MRKMRTKSHIMHMPRDNNAKSLRRLKRTKAACFYSFFICIQQTTRHKIPHRGIRRFSGVRGSVYGVLRFAGIDA